MRLSAVLFLSAAMVSGPPDDGRGETVSAVAVADGGSGGTIGLPKDASPIVRYAAELLGAKIERLCGKRPAVSLGGAGEAGLILATAASSPCPLSPRERDALGEEAYLVKAIDGPRGRRLVLVGGGDRGLLYGAARLADFGLRCDGQRVVL
jgi:alpha-glucuronidase